ncbi:lysophospholipid acyltransferase family protein [Paenibacillus beijingensis]|uniref:Acyl-phosphate glycerol 3-phosphate acyltransferase n=1 Tax=Paenibacillus beijingensis TaxID=1126833 RepID=A0A0D5NPL3_9BACL|nr:lysophospholipid acyltransferase family protein [Paenibacillus beijingensis]AJY77191.1 acyl-phosphate glycerol 3-phosphate acyltransferase [Paenibacillus beijingensis]
MVYRICRRLLLVIYGILFRLEAKGLENVPSEGPVILASNHLSNFDPPTVGIKVPRKVHYMAKAELFDVPLLGTLIRNLGAFPVKRGGVSKDSIRGAIALLKDGGVMGIFPEGTRNSKSESGKKGAAMIALRSGATVIPVKVTGTYKLFRKMRVTYGKPVDLTAFIDHPSSYTLEQVTAEIMSAIRKLS